MLVVLVTERPTESLGMEQTLPSRLVGWVSIVQRIASGSFDP